MARRQKFANGIYTVKNEHKYVENLDTDQDGNSHL